MSCISLSRLFFFLLFFFNDTATTEIYTLSLHDALPISAVSAGSKPRLLDTIGIAVPAAPERLTEMNIETATTRPKDTRSEEHTSELQSLAYLVCRLLLEKKKKKQKANNSQKAKTSSNCL